VKYTALWRTGMATAALLLGPGISSHGATANLSAPPALETTLTLPVSVRNPRFLNVVTQIDTKFAGDGGLEPLGNRLNKRVTWRDVLDAQSDEVQKNLVRAVLNDNGLSLDGSPGNATGVVKTYANVKVPVLAMGLTDRLTAAVVVPVVSIDVAVDTGFIHSSAEGQRFINHICDSSPDKCNEAAAKLNRATHQKLARLGYEPLNSHSVSGLGDIQLLTKYRWMEADSGALASKLALVLPTGTASNPNRALDITTGDGRYKIALGLLYDHYLMDRKLRWNTHATYTALLPSRQVKRLPTSNDDSLSADKEELTRNYGDQAAVGTALEYSITPVGMVVGAGFVTQYLGKTRYSGAATDAPTRARYSLLEALEPDQVLHAVTASVGFSTVDFYRRKEFVLPLQVNAVYSRPVGGRNAPRGDIFAGEMVLFF